MSTVFSADGTAIGFDAWGDGPPLVMIDGATAYRAMSPIAAQVGALLRDDFRTYAYDRRGRGESGDTPRTRCSARSRTWPPVLRQFAAAGQAIRH